ncbi:MAG: glycoside hydrolase family 88 protein, partial [Chloroflexi bacterium]|nr:glycoside hydrolase family 88 protein [Chloroflexota bacterium]
MTSLVPDINETIESLTQARSDIWTSSACGVTRSERSIPALVDRDAYASTTNRIRVLVLGSLSGRQEDAVLAIDVLRLFAANGRNLSDKIALSAVPCVNLDGLIMDKAPENGAGGEPSVGYPPRDNFFYDPQNPESRYLWRWVCFQAPDLILELRSGPSILREVNAAASGLGQALGAADIEPEDSLLAAIGLGNPDGLAPIPGLRITVPKEQVASELDKIWDVISQRSLEPSPARRILDARRARSPLEIARILASAYGHKLQEPIMYTQGVSISGRLRLAELDPSGSSSVADIASIVEPYASGAIDPFGDSPQTHKLAGVIWGDELANLTSDKRYAELVIKAASYYIPDEQGGWPPPADTDFRTEDMFLAGTILGRAFQITGDERFLDIFTGLLLNGNIQQEDGLFWHCRSARYFWGRGNGFAALGLTECLTYLPDDHTHRNTIMSMYVKLLDGLQRFRQPSGMYSQILDFPGSYQEHTSTCMIGYSMARGLRMG